MKKYITVDQFWIKIQRISAGRYCSLSSYNMTWLVSFSAWFWIWPQCDATTMFDGEGHLGQQMQGPWNKTALHHKGVPLSPAQANCGIKNDNCALGIIFEIYLPPLRTVFLNMHSQPTPCPRRQVWAIQPFTLSVIL